MDELQPNARALLDRARGAVNPSGEEVDALAARLGLPPSGGPSGGEPSPAPAGAGRLWLAVASVAALVAAGVGAWVSTPSPTRLVPSSFSVPPLPEPAVANPEPPAPAPEEEPSAIEPTTPTPPSKSRPAAKPEPIVEDDLQAELALMLRARRALKAGKPTEARDAATDYISRFPTGAFEEEARALELIASCNLAPTETLRETARERLAGAFAQRIRRACLEDE